MDVGVPARTLGRRTADVGVPARTLGRRVRVLRLTDEFLEDPGDPGDPEDPEDLEDLEDLVEVGDRRPRVCVVRGMDVMV